LTSASLLLFFVACIDHSLSRSMSSLDDVLHAALSLNESLRAAAKPSASPLVLAARTTVGDDLTKGTGGGSVLFNEFSSFSTGADDLEEDPLTVKVEIVLLEIASLKSGYMCGGVSGGNKSGLFCIREGCSYAAHSVQHPTVISLIHSGACNVLCIRTPSGGCFC
jgi:hypothetical protein